MPIKLASLPYLLLLPFLLRNWLTDRSQCRALADRLLRARVTYVAELFSLKKGVRSADNVLVTYKVSKI
jgi:hypothetical protein